jgi:hypothetical protein
MILTWHNVFAQKPQETPAAGKRPATKGKERGSLVAEKGYLDSKGFGRISRAERLWHPMMHIMLQPGESEQKNR